MTRKTNIFKSKRFARIARRVSAILAAAVAMSCVAASTIIAKNDNPVKAEIAKTQLSFPLPEFPADGNTYFNESETSACASHSGCDVFGGCSCLSYASSIQCAGFAIYAFDRYSHMSSSGSWSIAADDRHRNPNYPSTKTLAADLKKDIESLPIGSYVRLARTTSNPTTDGHSFVIVSTDNDGVTVYEANRGGNCKVQIKYYTYTELLGVFPYLYETVYHNYSTTKVNYDSSYHKIECKTSGCNGYIYEKHSFTLNKNGKFVCSGCGYISTVTPGVMSIEDNDL